jgi:hypothetical protein
MKIQFLVNTVVLAVVAILANGVSPVQAEETSKGKHRGEFKQEVQAYRQQQSIENKSFQKGLKEISAEEKISAIQEHRQEQFLENRQFNEGIHEKRMGRLKERLAKSKKMSEEEKQELIGFTESQHDEDVEFRQKKHDENMDFLDTLSAYSTPQEKREAIKAYRQQQKEESQAFHQSQRSENRAKIQEYKSE